MGVLRCIWRMTAILSWMLYDSLICLICCGRGWRGIARATYFSNLWGRGMARITGVHIHRHGELGEFTGRLVIANHTGYLDIITLAALTRVRFGSKKEVSKYPVVGWMLGTSRPVWIDRKNRLAAERTLNEFRDTLKNDINLLVFPEGTDSDGVSDLLAFKSTAFEAIAETKLPIQPVIIVNRPVNGWNMAWHGVNSPMLPHALRLLAQKRTDVDVYVLPLQWALDGEDRKALAMRMHAYMNAAWRTVRGGDASDSDLDLIYNTPGEK